MPTVRRIHSDHILQSGANRWSLEYWRKQTTDAIIESLRPGPGNPNALKIKPDGRIMDGNVRIKVLEERGFDINRLPRETLP
jgi:hypothetical protein